MKYAVVLSALMLTSCFRHYVYVPQPMPVIPVDHLERPRPDALVDELDRLSPAAVLDVQRVTDYAIKLRTLIDTYNAEAAAHNAAQ